MADRRIIVQENGRHTLRGLHMQDGHPALWMDKDEILTVNVDWSRWLGSATISSDTWTTDDNVTISSQSNTTTVSTVTISGDPGTRSDLTITMTASDGQKKQITVRVLGRTA
jgi:hypothetical protein